jgi:integrase
MYYVTEVVPTRKTYDDYYFIELGAMNKRHGNLNNAYRMYKMNYIWYWRDLKQALGVANVDTTLFATHDFRRCFARRAWEKYKDIHILQSLLNHQRAGTTLRYLNQSGLKNIDYHKDMQSSNDEKPKGI